MLKELGYLASWLPGTSVSLGLVGVMEGKTFIPKSSIRGLGVKFKTMTSPSTSSTMHFKSSKDIEVDVKVAGKLSLAAPSLPEAQAGVAVSFGEDTGVVFGASGITISRIKDILALEAAIWDLWDRFLWNPDWVVVTELVQAESTTILVSEGGYAKVELQAQGVGEVATVSLGELSADLTLASTTGMHTQLVSEQGLTPLFRAVRGKKVLFGRKMTGVRDPTPVVPGVVPRRDAGTAPEGLTQPATD
jgi:hypothetical protein